MILENGSTPRLRSGRTSNFTTFLFIAVPSYRRPEKVALMQIKVWREGGKKKRNQSCSLIAFSKPENIPLTLNSGLSKLDTDCLGQ